MPSEFHSYDWSLFSMSHVTLQKFWQQLVSIVMSSYVVVNGIVLSGLDYIAIYDARIQLCNSIASLPAYVEPREGFLQSDCTVLLWPAGFCWGGRDDERISFAGSCTSKPYECSACLKRFASAESHRVHTYYVHRAAKRHCCPACGRGFKKRYDLRKHLERCWLCRTTSDPQS